MALSKLKNNQIKKSTNTGNEKLRLHALNRQKVTLFIAIWLFLGYLFFAHILSSDYFTTLQRPVRHVTMQITFSIYIAVLLAPLVLLLSVCFPFDKRKFYIVIAVHFAGLVIFSLIYMNALQFLIERYIGLPPYGFGPRMRPRPGPLQNFFMQGFNHPRMFVSAMQHIWQSIFLYVLILGLSSSFTFYGKYRERQLHASQLETQLTNAQLSALKTQLQPHFLFNTLHTLSSLIYEDVPAADKMIRQLSDLLRLTLESSGDQEIPLKRELEHLQLYLEIMKIRFQERLSISYAIDAAAESSFIPTLLLQPLVENSIKHGLEASVKTGEIKITAAKVKDQVEIVVRDNGPGFSGPAAGLYSKGVGLANTVDRLQKLYGSKQSFKITSEHKGGTCVRLTFPYHTSPWFKQV